MGVVIILDPVLLLLVILFLFKSMFGTTSAFYINL
jgi:hypothetical protein